MKTLPISIVLEMGRRDKGGGKEDLDSLPSSAIPFFYTTYIFLKMGKCLVLPLSSLLKYIDGDKFREDCCFIKCCFTLI